MSKKPNLEGSPIDTTPNMSRVKKGIINNEYGLAEVQALQRAIDTWCSMNNVGNQDIVIQRQQTQIKELERKLEIAEINQRRAGAIVETDDNELRRIMDERDEFKQLFESAKSDLDSMVYRYGNIEQFVNPNRFIRDEIDAMLKLPDAKLPEGVVKFITKEAPLNIAWYIVAKKPDEDEYHYDTYVAMMQGNKSDFDEIVTRWRALAWQAPMPEDLQGPYLSGYGIDANMQLRAIQELAPYWHEKANPEEFFKRADEIFDKVLGVHVVTHKGMAKKRFKQSAKNTYERVLENRNIESQLPYGQVGRNKKKE